jgi:hypothetical protein
VTSEAIKHCRQVKEHFRVSRTIRQRARGAISPFPFGQVSRRGRLGTNCFEISFREDSRDSDPRDSPHRLLETPWVQGSRPASARLTTAAPDVMRLTPTTRPSVQAALDGSAQMMIPANTKSEMPLASIQPHDRGNRSR